jgi:hypothetical protein
MRQNCDKTAEKILNYKDLTTNIAHVERKNKSDRNKNRGKFEPSHNHPENI